MEELADEERASLTCGINQTKTQDDVQHVSSSNNSVPARTRKYVSAANATANERWKPPQNVTHRRRGRKRPTSSEIPEVQPNTKRFASLQKNNQTISKGGAIENRVDGATVMQPCITDDNEVIYSFAVAVARSGRILTTPEGVKLRERRRRKVRNRAGRYVLEFEVEFLGRNKQVLEVRWLSTREFLALWAADRIEDIDEQIDHEQRVEDGTSGNDE